MNLTLVVVAVFGLYYILVSRPANNRPNAYYRIDASELERRCDI